MTDELQRMLEELGERTQVGPAPVSEMRAAAGRSRRRSRLLVAGVAAASVLAVVGGADVWSRLGGNGSRDDIPAGVVAAPPGTRFVGIGHVAVAVPEHWKTNALSCGGPTEDTVLIDRGLEQLCGGNRQADKDSVELESGIDRSGDDATETISIDGHVGKTTPVTCAAQMPSLSPLETCRVRLFIPEEKVAITFESSYADAAQRVEDMLTWVTWLDDAIAVPGYEWANGRHRDDNAGEHYRRALEAQGLVARFVAGSSEWQKPGAILNVEPAAGSVVAPGSVVTVTVVPGGDLPRTSADEVELGVKVALADGTEGAGLGDAAVRSDREQITLPVGARLSLVATGEMAGLRLWSEVDGGGDSPLRPVPAAASGDQRVWEAGRRGVVTFIVQAERTGHQPSRLGVVIVIVQ